MVDDTHILAPCQAIYSFCLRPLINKQHVEISRKKIWMMEMVLDGREIGVWPDKDTLIGYEAVKKR